jgi:hypothetical protein
MLKVLLERISGTLQERVGHALFATTCIDPARFKTIAEHLVARADPTNQAHIRQGFAVLMESAMPLVCDRDGKRRWTAAMLEFFRTCKGLLVINPG